MRRSTSWALGDGDWKDDRPMTSLRVVPPRATSVLVPYMPMRSMRLATFFYLPSWSVFGPRSLRNMGSGFLSFMTLVNCEGLKGMIMTMFGRWTLQVGDVLAVRNATFSDGLWSYFSTTVLLMSVFLPTKLWQISFRKIPQIILQQDVKVRRFLVSFIHVCLALGSRPFPVMNPTFVSFTRKACCSIQRFHLVRH